MILTRIIGHFHFGYFVNQFGAILGLW